MYRYPVGGWAEVGARKESTVKRRLDYRVQIRATIFPQVDERMNKIQFPAEDLPSRSSSHLHPHYETVYTADLRNIIISLVKINNYGVYMITSLRPSHSFYLFAR